jgi:hypothetical protein
VLPHPNRNEGIEVTSKAARVAPAPGVAHLKRSAIMPRHACAAFAVGAFGGRGGRVRLRRPGVARFGSAETFLVPWFESGAEVVSPWCCIRLPRRFLRLRTFELRIAGDGVFDRSVAEPVARANAGIGHASCYRTQVGMKESK